MNISLVSMVSFLSSDPSRVRALHVEETQLRVYHDARRSPIPRMHRVLLARSLGIDGYSCQRNAMCIGQYFKPRALY